MKCSCSATVTFNTRTVRGATVFDDSYLIYVDCGGCGSTRNVTMWESEAQALYVEPRSERPLAAE